MVKFRRLILVLFILTLLFQQSICSNHNESSETFNTTSLPCNLNVIPVQYEISIGSITNYSVPVSVAAWARIKLDISKTDCNTSSSKDFTIKLNTRNCRIDLTNVNATTLANNEQVQVKIINQFLEENSTEENTITSLIIHFNESFDLGDQMTLYIPYEIQLTKEYYEESWQGFYYYDPQGINFSDIWTAYEQYPLHAQFMFPAFDYFNPTRKPVFKISVARYDANGFISLSNSDILESVQIPGMEQGWVMDTFQETPPMQVDQVTLMILGGYQNHTVHSAKNCTLNMWTLEETDGLYENNSALSTIKEIQQNMNFFENTFNQTEYPINKIDFIVIPWHTGGLVFHTNLGIAVAQAELMLLQEEYDTAMTRGFLRTQIVFQWFRGMVSSGIPPKTDDHDQDDVWIAGECLARYVGVWPLKDTKFDNTGTATYAFQLNIGKFLLEMIESLFSQSIMETAIAQIYLPKVLKDGAFPQDLYDSIQQAIELHNATHILPQNENGTVTVTEIFNSWLIKKYHYPTIHITEVINDTSSIALYQENISAEENAPTQMWWVPVKILTEKGNLLVTWLSPNHKSLNSSFIFSSEIDIDTENEWLFANPDSTGYYSTKYSDKLLQNIIKQLDVNLTAISQTGRKYLLYNQFTLAKGNKWEDIKSALDTTKYLGNEMDLDVWTIAIEQMGNFNYKFVGHSSTFGKYFGDKINRILVKIGVQPKNGEEANILKLRQKLMDLCSTYEIPLCTEYATDLMRDWMANNTDGNSFWGKFDAEALLCAAVENGNASVFHFMLNQTIKDGNAGDSGKVWHVSRICSSLACVNDADLSDSLLNENSELASLAVDKKGYLSCYREYIPHQIISRKPLTMKQSVYDFWMRETLNGNLEPGSLMRLLWILVPRGYEPPGFVDGILKFLEENDKLFGDDLRDNVRDFKIVIVSQPNRIEEFWKSGGIGDKMIKWFEDNME